MIKEYIKKAINTESGFDAECNVAIGIWIDLKVGCAVIMFDQYKDFASKEAGKAVMGKKEVLIEGINALPIFASVHDPVVDAILKDDKFIGATLEQVEVPDLVIAE